MAPLRIAVLECDTPLDMTRHKYGGGYGGVFRALLESGAAALAEEEQPGGSHARPVELEVTKYNVELEEHYPDVEDVDAVLITGSRHNSFDNDPWIIKLVDFTKSVLAQNRVRLIGVCFGHQIVGRALGARVDRSDKGWEISVTPMTLTETGKRLFGLEDISLLQMHKDIVYDIPAGVKQLAHSPRCTNQGMYAKGRLLTVQGHPEFTEEIVTELLEARHASGVFDDKMYGEGMDRVGNRHDGTAVGKAFVKLVLED